MLDTGLHFGRVSCFYGPSRNAGEEDEQLPEEEKEEEGEEEAVSKAGQIFPGPEQFLAFF